MDPQLTCFEPEAFGNLIEGMEFHKFYFDNGKLAFLAVLLSVVCGESACRILSRLMCCNGRALCS